MHALHTLFSGIISFDVLLISYFKLWFVLLRKLNQVNCGKVKIKGLLFPFNMHVCTINAC
jgi:hypothetical protein